MKVRKHDENFCALNTNIDNIHNLILNMKMINPRNASSLKWQTSAEKKENSFLVKIGDLRYVQSHYAFMS